MPPPNLANPPIFVGAFSFLCHLEFGREEQKACMFYHLS